MFSHGRPTRALWSVCALGRLSMAIAAATVPVVAQSAPEPSGWSGNIGIGVATAPTYRGSPNQRITPIPLLSLTYRSPELGLFQANELGFSWTFLNAGRWRLGVVTGLDSKRRSKEEKDGPIVQGDDRLRGMGDIPTILRAGPAVGYGPLYLLVRRGISHSGQGGL